VKLSPLALSQSSCFLLIRPWIAIFIATFVLAADFITKSLIHHYIPLTYFYSSQYPYGGIGIFKNFMGIEFSIIHATNLGAAWGVLAGLQGYLLLFRIVLAASLLVYVLFFNKEKMRQLPLALIIAGAIGNITDYFLYGHVVDMFHFVFWGYNYPIFNVADSAICVGVACLFVLSFKTSDEKLS
jgi:signal peptidase II